MLDKLFFIMDKDGNIKAASGTQWAEWFDNIDNRIIKVSNVGTFKISTVFTGINTGLHGLGTTDSMFETAIFDGPSFLDDDHQKHRTKEEALEYHDKMVEKYSTNPILEHL
jgi:hypothetical protein